MLLHEKEKKSILRSDLFNTLDFFGNADLHLSKFVNNMWRNCNNLLYLDNAQ